MKTSAFIAVKYMAWQQDLLYRHRKVSERYRRENPHKYFIHRMWVWWVFKLPGRETWEFSRPYPATWESCFCQWAAPDALKEGCTHGTFASSLKVLVEGWDLLPSQALRRLAEQVTSGQ